ncbi:hypothetical protein DFH27DRAFT_624728 [Peziza echinospora]|nr:hypothetical protein DFH27DRAFT_624728 [Peziza echinospora]
MPRIEVLPSGPATSGATWAYTTAPPPLAHTTAIIPTAPGAPPGNTKSTWSTRKDDKLQKHLLEFEKDNARDVVIPVPKATNTGRARPSGGTPTTRKILASQKTLTNHLSDEEAFLLQQQQQHGSISLAHIHPAHLSAGLRASRRDPPPPITDDAPVLGGWGLPLSHAAARADPPARPPRVFCEICGYWGKYRCLRCGARYCALECKETHEETRCQRFWV